MNAIITDNQRAKQKMNTMYLNQSGAKAKISVINFFAKGSIPFSIASIIFSAFGFYFDLFDGLGALGAGLLGIFLGFFIEGAKHYFTKGAFASFVPTWRIALAGGAFIFTVIAMAYHYKSMQTFENISVRTTLSDQVERETILKNKQLDAINATQNNNADLTSVLKNGTSHDDISATKSIKSNNQLAIELARMGTGTDTSNALLKQAEKTAHQNKNTLLLLFMTVELFSLFGIIAKGLLSSETGETVKSVITTSEKLATLEENVLQVVETGMINSTMQRIEASVNHSPTPTYATANNSQNQPDKAQMAFGANSGSNGYFSDYYTKNTLNTNSSKYLPTLKASNNDFSECYTQPSHSNEKGEEQKITEEEKGDLKEVVDLMKFNHKENEIIKVAFENGGVKKGDRLLSKRIVKKELEDNRLITKRDIDNCYEKLEGLGLINFKGGYRALANMENIVTNKSE